MTENEQGFAEAVEALEKAATMPADAARNYVEMLGCAAVHFMRAKFGPNYTRGWLESALSDLDRPPIIELRKPQ